MSQQTRVLVCEDDSSIRTLVELLLRRRGCTVDLAVDGAAAIDTLRNSACYDVVVLDLLMPRTNGYEVLEFLRKQSPELLSRVIVTTAFQNAFRDQLPVAAIIRKPFDINELAALVHRIAAGPPSPQSRVNVA